MKSIGIDINKKGIVIVEISADSSSFEILRGDYIPLAYQDDNSWEINVLQVLSEFGNSYDFENTPVTIALPQHLVSIRNLNFPFHRRTDILKSLPFELDEDLPFDIEDAVFDIKTVSTSSAETSVIAFSARIDDLQKQLDFLGKVNIDPDIISNEGSAMANLYENWGSGSFLMSPPDMIPTSLTVRLHFGHETTLLTVFHGQQMIWARSIFWGEKNIVNNLMKNYSLPYDQATDLIPNDVFMLVMMAGANAEQIKMSSVIDTALKELVHQVKLSILDIEDRFKSKVESIVLSGPVAFIANITPQITKYVGITTNIESFANDILKPRQVEPVTAFVERAPIAIGLAIEGAKRPKNPAVNLRRGLVAKKNVFWERTWTKWKYTFALCCVAYVCYLVYGITREQVAFELDEVANENLVKSADKIAGLKGREASPDRIERYLKTEEEKAKNAKLFEKANEIEPAMKVVNTLSSLLPANKNLQYDIRRVDVKSSSIVIEGEAQQQHTVNEIKKKLEGLSSDKRVQAIPVSIKKTKGVAFAFKLAYKG
ncbi:MAG: pilus assembly protein PilM [Bdellovibrionales bacterium]|nr:pilus assembly protein PilM [Bdellovibrionales bacterium]